MRDNNVPDKNIQGLDLIEPDLSNFWLVQFFTIPSKSQWELKLLFVLYLLQMLTDFSSIWFIWKPYKNGFFKLFFIFSKSCRGASCGRGRFRFIPQSLVVFTTERTAWMLRQEENTMKPASQLVCEADSQARGEPVDETERLVLEFQVPINTPIF